MNSYRRPVNFKRSRIPRRKSKYRPGINTAVLFVVVFVIACTVGTVMLGNYLKDRTEKTPDDTVTAPPHKDTETTKSSDGLSNIEPADGSIRSGCLDISGISSADELDRQIRTILASGYDAITIPIAENGELLYYSPTAVTLSHMDSNAPLPTLTSIIEKIKNIGFEYSIAPTVTLFYPLSSQKKEDPVLIEASFLFETAISTELVSLGADEILISGFSVSGDADADKIITFTEKLKASNKKMRIGIALPHNVFSDNGTAHILEKLSSAAGFFAVDLTELDWSHSVLDEVLDEAVTETDENGIITSKIETVHIVPIYENILEIAESIKGSTALYGLRFMLRGDDNYVLSEAVSALSYRGAYDFYVITSQKADPDEPYGSEDETEEDEPKESEKETKPPKKEDTTKPPETTKAPETTAETTTEAVTEAEEETTIDPENWEWFLNQ